MNCKNFATRALSILLCIVMLVGMIPVSVGAEDAIALALDTVSIDMNNGTVSTDADGEYFTATVNLKVTANAGFAALKGDLAYPEELKLLSATDAALDAALVNQSSSEAEDLAANPYKVAYVAATSETNVTSTGTLMTFTFRVPVADVNTTHAITFTPTEATDAALTDVLSTVTASAAGAVKIVGEPVIFSGSTLAQGRRWYQQVKPATNTSPQMYHLTGAWNSAASATSDNPSPTMTFTNPASNVDISATPVLKMYYRTDKVVDGALAVPTNIALTNSSYSDKKFETYYVEEASAPATKAGEWGYIIMDFSDAGFTSSVKAMEIPAKNFVESGCEHYLDVAYLGFFASVDAAKAATFRPLYTVTYVANGETVATQEYWKEGATITYPDVEVTAPAGTYLSGWSVAEGTTVDSDFTVNAVYGLPRIFAGATLKRPDARAYYQDVTAATDTTPIMYHLNGAAWDSSKSAAWNNQSPTIEFPKSMTDNTAAQVDTVSLPIVKVYYRTNKMDGDALAAPTTLYATDAGWSNRSFANYMVEEASDLATEVDEWGYITLDLTSINAKIRSIGADKFVTSLGTDYIDIPYIGFFPTLAAAQAASMDVGQYYTVTFMNGEEVYETKYLEYGSVVEVPEVDPTSGDQFFGGWQDASGNTITDSSTVTGNMTISAVFAEPVTVTFMNGDVVFKTITIATGAGLVYPEEIPTQAGKAFAGWDVAEGTIINEAKTVNATYIEPIVYTGDTLIIPANRTNSTIYRQPTAAKVDAPRLYKFKYDASKRYTLMFYTLSAETKNQATQNVTNVPVLKVIYRTDKMDGDNLAVPTTVRLCDSNWNYPSFATYYDAENSDPATVAGEWGTLIINLSGYSNKNFREIDTSMYFAEGDTHYLDIAYVGFFPSVESAVAAEGLTPLYTVTYKNGDETVATQEIWATGATLSYPEVEITAPEGKFFTGWDVAEGTTIASDRTVNAVFGEPLIFAEGTLKRASNRAYWQDVTPATATEPAMYHFNGAKWDSSKAAAWDNQAPTFSFPNAETGAAATLKITGLPVMKFYYRTNKMDGENLAVPNNLKLTSGGWTIEGKSIETYVDTANSKIATEVDEWGYLIVDFSSTAVITSDKGIMEIAATSYITSLGDDYLDIPYIGFFPNVDSAVAATFDAIDKEPVAPTTATVTFLVDGVAYGEPQTVEIGSELVYPEVDPAKDGYRFTGWDAKAGTIVEADMEVNAEFVQQFTVKFLVNGEQYGEILTVDAGTALVLPEVAPEVEGYRFDGWDAKADAVVEDNMEINAIMVQQFTVTFLVNGEQYEEILTVDAGAALVLPEVDPEVEGFRFLGWDAKAGDIINEDTVVNAQFVELVTITFTANGEEFDSVTVDAGTALELPEAPELTGYRFVEWDAAEGDIIDVDTVVNAIYVKLVTITFMVDGEEYDEVTVDAGTLLTYPEVDPSSDEWVFNGWDTEEGTEINKNTTVKANLTYKHTLLVSVAQGGAFTVNGGDEVTSDEIYELDGTNVTLKAVAADTFKFIGWYDNTNGYNELISKLATIEFTINGDANIEARFISETVAPMAQIAVVPNDQIVGGTVNVQSGEVSIGEQIELTATPDTGKQLAYWTRVSDGNVAYVGAADAVAVDPLGSSVVYTPVFVDEGTETIKLYINHQGMIVGVDEEPAVPTEIGFTYSAWEKTGDEGIVEIYTSAREANSETYKLTVKFANGTVREYEFQTYDYVIFSSSVDDDVQWVLDGTVISYSSDLGFHIAATADAVLEEVVVTEAAEAIVLGLSAVYDAGANKIVFTATQSVPENFEFVQCGVLLAKEGTVADTANMTLETDGVIIGKSTGSSTDTTTFVIRKGKVEQGDTWYGRPYLIYKEGDLYKTIYADTMSATAN